MMISFSCRKATGEDIKQAEAWPSAAPLFDDVFFASRMDCHALLDQRNGLCGILGVSSQMDSFQPTDHPHQKPRKLSFVICFSPNFRVAFRQRAIEFALWQLRERHSPSFLDTYVYARDGDLLNIYKRLGFSMRSQAGERILLERDDRPFLDASVPLQSGILQYDGDPLFERTLCAEKENGGYNVSFLKMSVHTGTHIDTPTHVGLCESNTIDLSLLHGSVQLIDWQRPNFDAILSNRILLARAPRGLTQEEAGTLLRAGVLLVGMDRLSVGIDAEEWIVHQSLLKNGVILLENADLRLFSAGWYQMRCLPLSIPGSDGIPVRLLLREEYP